jgi:predicted DNA-binding transcriptional regulator AlpA
MMRRETAAMYCDISAAEFEREVASGRLPMPVKLGNHEHWSRQAIDEMLTRLVGDPVPDWRKRSPLYGYGTAA